MQGILRHWPGAGLYGGWAAQCLCCTGRWGPLAHSLLLLLLLLERGAKRSTAHRAFPESLLAGRRRRVLCAWPPVAVPARRALVQLPFLALVLWVWRVRRRACWLKRRLRVPCARKAG